MRAADERYAGAEQLAAAGDGAAGVCGADLAKGSCLDGVAGFSESPGFGRGSLLCGV